MMFTGENCWNKTVTEGMETRVFLDRERRTYENLPKSLYSSFTASLRRTPEKTALVDDGGKAYSYRELYGLVCHFAKTLQEEWQVKKGEHVAVMLYNSAEFAALILALNKIGAVAVPLPTKYKQEEIIALVSRSDVKLAVVDGDFISFFEAYPNLPLWVLKPAEGNFAAEVPTEAETIEADPEAMALLMFTSGTTSLSKGVCIHNYNIMHAIVSYERAISITSQEKAILPVPMYLITGLVAIFGLLMHVGGTVYLNKRFDAPRVLSDIQKYGITFFHASPTVFTLILSHRDAFPQLPTLRAFACGSSNMPPGKIKMLYEWIPQAKFHTVYGLTETTSPGTIFPVGAAESEYIGSSGVPIPGMNLKIVDDDGAEVPPGTEGRVLLSGTNITPRYYKMDSAMFTDGWLDTGDIGYVNEAGYLYIVDRKKDMINRGGEKVCSYDVENELLNICEIADAAVVGIPHELYGETPAALVKLKPGRVLTEEDIKKTLKTKMASFKVPSKILFAAKIPLTANMKPDKKKIRELLQEEK